MSEINYSIVIPHKDIPQLLQRCLDSIPLRRDTQVVIVDDDSDPATVDFDRFPGAGRPDTEVYFTKEGKGAGYARNIGLAHARGKWIIFADADDFFTPCFDEMLDRYQDAEYDIVYFKVTSVDSQTMLPHTRHLQINSCLSKIQETHDWSFCVLMTSVWARFIKRDLLKQNNIVFQETAVANDTLFSAKLAMLDLNRVISENIIYCVTHRDGSLEGNRNIGSLKTRFEISCHAYRFLKKSKKANYYYAACGYWWMEAFFKNRLIGVRLLPELFATCGIYYGVKGVFWAFDGRR
jgi:glycosyltransferase involved in cell wall biosynthesis